MIKKISTTQLIWLGMAIGMAIVLCGVLGTYIYKPDLYDPILTLIICLIVVVCGSILLEIFGPRENLERWIYESIQTKWKFQEHKKSFARYLEKFSLFLILSPIIYIIFIPIAFLVLLFWFICERDIIEFSEVISNFMSVILVLIFIVQTLIFYHHYRYMKQPPLEKTLIWAFSKSKGEDNCCIFLKNGGNAPVFNISYQISEVSVKDKWGFKRREDKEISKDFLSRLDGGSEKKIFEKPAEEFKKMRLTVFLSAKSLERYSILLFFYKAEGKDDFSLVNVKYGC